MGIELFWKGFIVGLMVSIPLGPIGVLCIQRTLNKGRQAGFVSGLGAASADTIFSIIAALGVGYIIKFVRDQHLWFQIIGGIIVIFLGIHIFYSNPIRQLRLQRMNKNKLSYDFFSVFFLTITNPMAIFFFLAMFTGIHIASETGGIFNISSLVLGVLAGASTWWFVLSSFVNFWRHRFRLKIIWWMNKVAGVIIFSLGILTILSIWLINT